MYVSLIVPPNIHPFTSLWRFDGNETFVDERKWLEPIIIVKYSRKSFPDKVTKSHI